MLMVRMFLPPNVLADLKGKVPSSLPFTKAVQAFISVGDLPFASEWGNKNTIGVKFISQS